MLHGTDGNVSARLALADYRRLFPDHVDIEPFWGLAPGQLLNDGRSFYILGKQFGKVFVGMQPSFGYERDPMRLLMAKDAAPHHGFAAFYTWIEQIFGADAVLHFGTHGALEFVPGKQAGMSASCWPARLLGSLPNFYYYSVNNPSEATIAKRRGAATLIGYMVPPLQQAGLYKRAAPAQGRHRLLPPAAQRRAAGGHPRAGRADWDRGSGFRAQDRDVDTSYPTPEPRTLTPELYVAALAHELIQVEQRMIPMGLHVLGALAAPAELADILALVSAFYRIPAQRLSGGTSVAATLPETIAAGLGWDYEGIRARLKTDREAQARWERIDQILREAMCHFVELRMENEESRNEPREPVLHSPFSILHSKP